MPARAALGGTLSGAAGGVRSPATDLRKLKKRDRAVTGAPVGLKKLGPPVPRPPSPFSPRPGGGHDAETMRLHAGLSREIGRPDDGSGGGATAAGGATVNVETELPADVRKAPDRLREQARGCSPTLRAAPHRETRPRHPFGCRTAVPAGLGRPNRDGGPRRRDR